MSKTQRNPWLNHGGTSSDNPILDGESLIIKLSKQGINETLRKAWVVVNGQVFSDITKQAVTSEFEITFPVTAGTHIQSNDPPVKNTIHITTSEHRHAQADIWCATQPSAMITLNGYDGSDWQKPLIYPLYNSELP